MARGFVNLAAVAAMKAGMKDKDVALNIAAHPAIGSCRHDSKPRFLRNA